MTNRILNRATRSSQPSATERVFDRRVKKGAQLLAERPDLTEEQLGRLLALADGVDEFETVAAAELVFFRRELLSAHLQARHDAPWLRGARRVA
jgi:hypothetical protein